MNIEEQLIIKSLKASIYNDKIRINEEENKNLEKLYIKAKGHQILSLIYNTFDRAAIDDMDNTILEKWKTDVFKSNMLQIYLASRYKKIISDLNKIGINLIVLKGSVIRNYYIRPELRTMGDLDILINMSDFKKVSQYFLDNGFTRKDENHPVHAEFINEKGVSVEVHWKLINNETYIANTDKFEESLWNNAIDYDYYGTNVKSLCKEDFLLHLCIHMAKHLRGSGFGLRQVYDIVVISIAEYDNIDWIEFEKKAEECGVLRFSITLFKLINSLFDLNLYGEIIKRNDNIKCDYLVLLEEILSYDAFKYDERKITVNKISINSDEPCFYKVAHKFYRNIKDKVENELKDEHIKKIINRRKVLLKQFDLN